MDLNNELLALVERQIASSSGINLYYSGTERIFSFHPDMKRWLLEHREDVLKWSAEERSRLVRQVSQAAIREFYRSNQYIHFDEQDIKDLGDVYRTTWSEFFDARADAPLFFEAIEQRHLQRLAAWLSASNPFIRTLNPENTLVVNQAVCAEYSPELQLDLLGIDLDAVQEPVLDIGCGEHGRLVQHLRAAGIDARGFDRLITEGANPWLVKADWFSWKFEPAAWGTVVANLSFTLHFHHHHLRADGNFAEYARLYRTIVDSLKPGGRFHYAPSLPMVEQHLPDGKFAVKQHLVYGTLSASIITRLK